MFIRNEGNETFISVFDNGTEKKKILRLFSEFKISTLIKCENKKKEISDYDIKQNCL